MLDVLLLYVICASTFTISKAALQSAEPLFFTGVRMIIAGAFLLVYEGYRGRRITGIYMRHIGLFVQIVLVYIYAAYVLDILALQHMSSAKGCLFYNLSPFVSALFSYWFFAEHMTIKKWVGLVIGFVSFIPVVMTHASSEVAISGGIISWGEIEMFGAVLASVYGWILVRQLIKEHEYSSVLINGIGMFGGGVLSLLTYYIVYGGAHRAVYSVSQFWLYIVLIIVIANFAFANMYSILLKKYTVTFLSFAGFTAPLFASIFGWVFLGETVSWDFFATTALVVVGLYIFYQEELRQGYIAEK